MSETADAVIIGGGVIGTSIAYHLARKKFGQIILLERDTLASGSTGLSVATIDSLTMQEESVELFAQSVDFFRHCAEILGTPCGYVETGSIFLGSERHEKQLLAAVERMQAANTDIRALKPVELAEIESRINLDGVAVASYAPHAGYADPALTTNAFAKAAKAMGVRIHQGRTAINLLSKGGKITGVNTSNGPIFTPVVTIAAGPWSNILLQAVEVDLQLSVVSHPVVMIRQPANFGPQHPALLDLATGMYARPESANLTLLGSLDPQIGHYPADPNGRPGFLDDQYILWAMDQLTRRFPTLSASEIGKGWAGFMTLSTDWQPVIGSCRKWRGLYCAVGFSGLGFQISPAVGDWLSGLIAGEDSDSQKLRPFAPSRFSSGQLLQTYRETITHGV